MPAVALSPALRLLLGDPSAALPTPSPEARADALLRAHVLDWLSRILAPEGLDALLVKGAALALTVYPAAAVRPMSDLDLLVRASDRDRVVAVLTRAGFADRSPVDRPHSGALLGETLLVARSGVMETLVEVHTTLDKLVARPIDERDLFARAHPAPGLPHLLVPAPEDHALLIALHAAGHDFHHPLAFLDLELLLRAGLDLDVLTVRARAWRLTTVMWRMLSLLREQGGASVSVDGNALIAAFEPAPLRRALLLRAGAAGEDLGLPWILRQTPLRDDVAAWSLGVGRYAASRARDRLARPGGAVQDGAVSYRVPLWVRALLAADRASMKLENLRDGLRDELLLAWIPPADRAALTATLYWDQSTYLPGGARFKSGLFSWEKRVLDASRFPRAGRVLVGAAGAGREMVALLERGFSVVAFDPCPPFVEAARSVAPADRATVVQASYADLVDVAAGGGGPLAEACRGAPFDAVVLGWGSLSHVMPASGRLALLRAVRALAPGAPVLTSFALEADLKPAGGGKGRVRNGLRRLFGALDAPGASEVGDRFFPSTGFFSYLDADDVVKLAWETGYEIALFEEAPYPHALLVPLGSARAGLGVNAGARAGNHHGDPRHGSLELLGTLSACYPPGEA